MTSPQLTGWFAGRTKLVTAAAVVAIVLAGAAAVGANIGILDSAANGTTGNLSAAGDLPAPGQAIGRDPNAAGTPRTNATPSGVAAAVTVAPAIGSGGAQRFSVDSAGTVTLVTTPSGLRTDAVEPSTGWVWRLEQPIPGELTIVFSNGARTLAFTGRRTAEGAIAASVDEPTLTTEPVSTGASPPATAATNRASTERDDDRYEGGEDDD